MKGIEGLKNWLKDVKGWWCETTVISCYEIDGRVVSQKEWIESGAQLRMDEANKHLDGAIKEMDEVFKKYGSNH